MSSDRPEQSELSYEEAREELIEVVRALESGGGTLEESLALWERGEKLATICQSWLDGARSRLERAIAQDTDHDDVGGPGETGDTGGSAT